MTKTIRKGSKVSWHWGAHTAHGKVVERFTSRVARTIKGTEVVRDASRKEPAYLIEQEDGDAQEPQRAQRRLGQVARLLAHQPQHRRLFAGSIPVRRQLLARLRPQLA